MWKMIIDLDKKLTTHLQKFPHVSIEMERWDDGGTTASVIY